MFHSFSILFEPRSPKKSSLAPKFSAAICSMEPIMFFVVATEVAEIFVVFSYFCDSISEAVTFARF